MNMCGKGWGARCAAAKSKRCRCRCGGENHGATKPLEEGGSPYVAVEDLLNDVVKVSGTKIYRNFPYEGYFGRQARCDLAVVANGKVVIATERSDNPGASITNCAESLAKAIQEKFGDVIVVEHYVMDRIMGESLSRVWIENGSAKWTHLDRTGLAAIIALAVT